MHNIINALSMLPVIISDCDYFSTHLPMRFSYMRPSKLNSKEASLSTYYYKENCIYLSLCMVNKFSHGIPLHFHIGKLSSRNWGTRVEQY